MHAGCLVRGCRLRAGFGKAQSSFDGHGDHHGDQENAPDFLGERLDAAGGLIDMDEIESVKEVSNLGVGEEFGVVFARGAIDGVGLVAGRVDTGVRRILGRKTAIATGNALPGVVGFDR